VAWNGLLRGSAADQFAAFPGFREEALNESPQLR